MQCDGFKSQVFVLDKSSLFQSPFFQAAFEGAPRENSSGEQHIELPDTNPETFARFVRWFTTKSIFPPASSGEPIPTCEHVAQLWEMGEVFQFHKLQNDAIIALERARVLHDIKDFTPHFIRTIYQGTAPGCPLRGYVADVYSRYCPTIMLDPREYPQTFLQNVINILRGPTIRNIELHSEQPSLSKQYLAERYYVSVTKGSQ